MVMDVISIIYLNRGSLFSGIFCSQNYWNASIGNNHFSHHYISCMLKTYFKSIQLSFTLPAPRFKPPPLSKATILWLVCHDLVLSCFFFFSFPLLFFPSFNQYILIAYYITITTKDIIKFLNYSLKSKVVHIYRHSRYTGKNSTLQINILIFQSSYCMRRRKKEMSSLHSM